MRCKNCGYRNNNSNYICENCGSPLYEDGEVPVQNKGLTAEQKRKATIIVLLISSFIAVSVGIAILVINLSRSQDLETTVLTTSTEQAYTENTTTIVAIPETTTTTSTTAVITTSPTTTTETPSYSIRVNSEIGGSILGFGDYKKGKTCTLKVSVDEGYQFEGWYENGSLISTEKSYSFVVTSDRTLKAKFKNIEIPTTEETIEAETIE